jgi:hypothetical protein
MIQACDADLVLVAGNLTVLPFFASCVSPVLVIQTGCDGTWDTDLVHVAGSPGSASTASIGVRVTLSPLSLQPFWVEH